MTENIEDADASLVEHIRNNAGLAIGIGVVMLIAGLIAVASPAIAGLSITWVVGLTLAIGGISECFLAFKAGALGKGLIMFIVGALMAMVGFFMVSQPVAGLASLTIFLMASLIATGILEIGVAFQLRPSQGWGLQLMNGILTLLLGILLWRQFPLSGVWAIGVLFGIKMIFSGWALIFIGRAFKRATSNDAGTTSTASG